LKYIFTLLFLFVLSLQHGISQDTIPKTSTRLSLSKERSDSLANSVRQTTGFINDFVQLFSEKETRTLDSLVSTFEKTTTVEIGVATVNSAMVKDQDFEDYTLVMMRMWGVGKKEKNNGILIVIAPDLRRIRIQNGYGIEKILSDNETKQIIDSVFLPKFREGKYFEATREGIIAIMNKLKQNGL
jgi:uncharacterized protein